uniref:Lrp/AsnC family transcriptional regulator n=1 Tax=Actinomadura kijaniata TaxID=46161 RepID=UPI000836712D
PRRYRRLRAEAGLRVVGLPDLHQAGRTRWVVRLTATPAAARSLARALARRPDTSWVRLTSGGTEIFAIVDAPHGGGAAASLLLRDVPRSGGVLGVSAHCLLHTYRGGPTTWHGRVRALSEEQCRLLAPPTAEPVDGPPPTDAERALIDALRHDGRATHADLAGATGWSPDTVARRLAALRARGAVFFDVEIDDAVLGVTTQALLWMSVAPAHLDRVAATLAAHPEPAAVVATTGPTNLLAQVLCSDPADLHRYLTRRLGALPEIRAVESAPVLLTLKAAGHLTPAARPAPRRGEAGS